MVFSYTQFDFGCLDSAPSQCTLISRSALTTSILGGALASLVVAIGLRLIQSAKVFGTRFILAVVIEAVLVGLLAGLVPKFLS